MSSSGAACDCTGAIGGSAPGPTLASTCGGQAFMVFMGLLEVFLRSQCDLEDPCNRPRSPPRLNHEYDFIVVGGGSAGSVIANRLSEINQWKVLLIEAGGDEPTGTQVPSMFLNFLGSDIDWRYHTEAEEMACLGEDGQKCFWPRGKVLGGTSVMNGMMYIRGSREDFDGWARDYGATGWSYEEVLPYFIKSEDNLQPDKVDRGFHGVGGYLPVSQFPYHPPLSFALLEAGQELGYPVGDLNGDRRTGFAIAQTTQRNGSRVSAARAFIRPIVQRRNLHILLNSTVTKIVIDPNERRAIGIEYIPGGVRDVKPILIRATKEVIVSAGTVASPQLLLQSGIGDSNELNKVGVKPVHHLPAVGKNLHNHVAHFVNFFINDTDTQALNWATAMEYLLFRDGLMSGTGISEVTALVHSQYSDPTIDNPDLQFFFGGYLANCAKTGQVGEQANPNGTRRVINFIPAVLHPKSRGHITLRDANPLSSPKIVPRYLTHPDDVRVLVDGIKFAIRMAQSQALSRYGFELDKTPVQGCGNLPFGCDAYWECAIRRQTGPENHQAGSCRMGALGDPNAVVDNKLRVQGLRGLRVGDASVMPQVTSGNTNAPTIMIGERLADFVKDEWLGGVHQASNNNWY